MAKRTSPYRFQILCHDVEDQQACVVRYLKQILSELVDMQRSLDASIPKMALNITRASRLVPAWLQTAPQADKKPMALHQFRHMLIITRRTVSALMIMIVDHWAMDKYRAVFVCAVKSLKSCLNLCCIIIIGQASPPGLALRCKYLDGNCSVADFFHCTDIQWRYLGQPSTSIS